MTKIKKSSIITNIVGAHMCLCKKKRLGITITELLLGVAIVGVIASLTVPGLIKGYKFKAYESSIKNFYAAVRQAVTLYMAHGTVTDLKATNLYGTSHSDISDDDSKESINDFVMKYFHVAEVCEPSKNNCFAASYRTFDGQPMNPDFTIDTKSDSKTDYMLNDGSVMRIGFTPEGPIEIFVDTNGMKNPNRAGYDLWAMNIYNDGSIDEAHVAPDFHKTAAQANNEKQELITQLYEQKCKQGSYRGCFGNLVKNGFSLNAD